MSSPSSELSLHTPVRALHGVRAAQADALADLGVKNLGQLIAYLPSWHERHEPETNLGLVQPDTIVTVRGEVTATRSGPPGRGKRPRFEAVLCDPTGRLELVWFNAPFMRRTLHPGMRIRVHGDARRYGPGIQLANPRYEILKEGEEEPDVKEGRIRPVYPASEKIPSKQIEQIIASVLDATLPLIEDHLTPEYRKLRELPELRDAYRMMHAPQNDDDAALARRRLAYDELLFLQLGVQIKRAHLRDTLSSPALKWSAAIDAHIRQRFPFELTHDQDGVIKDVVADVTRDTPTNRLIQGDVGSGKTVVALYAMLLGAASGHQSVLMAPTEILAEQHFASISRVLAGSKVRIELLTGSLPGRQRADLHGMIERGEVDLVVGTHAILSAGVKFKSLAVAIIDEQHRFGVHQRAALRSKGASEGAESVEGGAAKSGSDSSRPLTPHVLVMTATPIPRTLTLTLFGDLDVSTIRSLPPGRKPIRTRVLTPDKTDEVYDFVRKRLDAGDQAYVVVPAIDSASHDPATSPEESIASVESVVARLRERQLAGVSMASMHARLSRAERDEVMSRFRAGEINALISTTVIEVGVDVPNATVMVVEQADRFGLSQLHQLRGRVGRGGKQSVCILIGSATTEDAEKRLAVMRDVTDGFVLAEKDFEIRGPGEVLGTRQAGAAPFKVADLMRDRDLLRMATRDAERWVGASPLLLSREEAVLRRRLLKLHGPWIGLADVG